MAEDDQRAIESANKHKQANLGLELWRGDRLVHEFAPEEVQGMMTDNDDDQFSKLLSDSQAEFERDVLSFKKEAVLAESATAPAISARRSLPPAHLFPFLSRLSSALR